MDEVVVSKALSEWLGRAAEQLRLVGCVKLDFSAEYAEGGRMAEERPGYPAA